jgi:hypothetical protein
MKTIIWSLFILTLAIWTGMTMLTVHLVDWIVQSFGNTLPTDLGTVLNTVPVPPWLAVWIDPAWIQTIQSGLGGLIEGITQSVPYFASAISWLSPLIWVIWGFGALALLIVAVGGHWLIGSFSKTPLP